MTLTIAGGWYEEICAEPHWQEFYGPGGRAAAALSGRRTSVRLVTYCPTDFQEKLNYFAGTFGFDVESSSSAPSVTRFQYLHWLRGPQITPDREFISELPPIHVEDAELAIRFGFYEGDAVVKSKRAVYDPQNAPERARRFEENGSTTDELAVVCNFAEGAKLTGETAPEKILDGLLRGHRVKMAAVKGAWEGVWVATGSKRELVKPIPTRHVHKIGSGDVFTAEFGYGWMVLGLDAVEAARRASMQVAHYCEGSSLPLPETATVAPALPPSIPPLGADKKYDVYVAAPFFNYAQLSVVEELAMALRDADLAVFSPYHDVGLGHASQVAKQDLEALQSTRLVVAYLEGNDPGTIFEVGYARALGIPVLVYSPNLAEINSTMFVGSGCEIARDFTTALYRAVWWAKGT